MKDLSFSKVEKYSVKTMNLNKVILKNRIIIVAGTIIFFYAITLLLPRGLFYDLIKEDGFFEYMTAFLFLISAIVFFLIFIEKKFLFPIELRSGFKTRSRRYIFLIFALVFFFGFGEEISWGQRIIGFATPESIANNNIRDEFTIHNLELFSAHDAEGQNKGTLSKLYTMKQLFLYCFFIFLFVVPVLNGNSRRFRNLFKQLYIPIPPLWLGVLFIGNYVFYRVFRFFTDQHLEPVMNSYITEMQEFNFSIILLLLPFSWFGLSALKNNSGQTFK